MSTEETLACIWKHLGSLWAVRTRCYLLPRFLTHNCVTGAPRAITVTAANEQRGSSPASYSPSPTPCCYCKAGPQQPQDLAIFYLCFVDAPQAEWQTHFLWVYITWPYSFAFRFWTLILWHLILMTKYIKSDSANCRSASLELSWEISAQTGQLIWKGPMRHACLPDLNSRVWSCMIMLSTTNHVSVIFN